MIDFANRLKELMKETNKDENEIAKYLGMDYTSMIYDWENGLCLPNFNNLIKLADLFKVNLDYLLGLTENYEEVVSNSVPPFDQHFRAVLKRHKCSQYKLLKKEVVSRGHLNSWFNNKSLPSVDNLVKLAEFLEISLDELVGRV